MKMASKHVIFKQHRGTNQKQRSSFMHENALKTRREKCVKYYQLVRKMQNTVNLIQLQQYRNPRLMDNHQMYFLDFVRIENNDKDFDLNDILKDLTNEQNKQTNQQN